jgi:NAD-specific glutamate dehydrogenase
MKFRFDLLPEEYKSLPRDTLGIALAVLTIIASISAVGTMYIKNKSELNDVQLQVNEFEKKVRDLIVKTEKLQPPLNEVNALKNRINFINKNLNTPGTSWVDFLAAFESAVPENVVITDISPKTFNKLTGTFTVIGEAATIFDALEFAKRLNQTGRFTAFLKNNNNVSQSEGSVQKFTLDFTYKPN